MDSNGCTIERIEIFRQEGADYFVTTKQDVIDSSVLDDIKDKYEVIRATNEFLIVKL